MDMLFQVQQGGRKGITSAQEKQERMMASMGTVAALPPREITHLLT